ncbi:hypothetical protein QNI19_11795 [Cytophagaceae bacterium DM2B3-1]|uniref:Uncharacterized protein n=2 Tax=Xanthocytophaga TaxID=3078918 RepID=A0AAE3QL67_9BACT|nr:MULTISPECIES: hypothetical protein [Xanthocytophaga]MDJ1469670.1 hypothetical protein [Xanthocytophaga flavus]MDJ1480681.1 hypothetical protein [Xanthocytophaga flavus]MDJ1493617.1 hypothetical protein [Xanthocytophaga flavus]MDJ1506391.1 hypothetical protein [Xanthocytophaga agilis]
MEQWKLEEITLLQSDIALFLQQLGLDPARIKTVSDFAEHQGACSEEEINFLNARFHRISQLLTSVQR